MSFKETEPSDFRRSDRGSVLMEFIIIAPIYFLLLGGLFMVADLAVNKIRMHIGDELVTWLGASRFCPQDGAGKRDPSKVADSLKPIFERSIGGAIIGFKVSSTRDALQLNDFMSCYSGGIVKLPVRIPEWVRGMMSMADMMSGKADSEWRNRSEVEMDCDYERIRVFHRHALSGIDLPSDLDDPVSRDRNISARDMIVRGYLVNVIDGSWIHLAEGNDGTGMSLTDGQDIPAGRLLGQFGE